MKNIIDVLGPVYSYLKNCLEWKRIFLNTATQKRGKRKQGVSYKLYGEIFLCLMKQVSITTLFIFYL